jgi:hypothetical protein
MGYLTGEKNLLQAIAPVDHKPERDLGHTLARMHYPGTTFAPSFIGAVEAAPGCLPSSDLRDEEYGGGYHKSGHYSD